MKKSYLVSSDCIERFMCKMQNVKDAYGKYVFIAVMDLGKDMMKESIESIEKVKELAEEGFKNAEKKIDADSFQEMGYRLPELLETLNKPEAEDVVFSRWREIKKSAIFWRNYARNGSLTTKHRGDLRKSCEPQDISENEIGNLNFEDMAEEINDMISNTCVKDIRGEEHERV